MLLSVALSAQKWQHADQHLQHPLPDAVTSSTAEELDGLLADSCLQISAQHGRDLNMARSWHCAMHPFHIAANGTKGFSYANLPARDCALKQPLM